MFDTIVVMFESATGVVRRIYINAPDFSSELLLQRFKREQVVSEDQSIIEDVVLSNSMPCMVRKGRIFQQDTRLESRPILFADPGKLKFLFLHTDKLRTAVSMDTTAETFHYLTNTLRIYPNRATHTQNPQSHPRDPRQAARN